MYITENLKSYLAKSEQFTPSEAFSGITARDFLSAQFVGDCDDDTVHRLNACTATCGHSVVAVVYCTGLDKEV